MTTPTEPAGPQCWWTVFGYVNVAKYPLSRGFSAQTGGLPVPTRRPTRLILPKSLRGCGCVPELLETAGRDALDIGRRGRSHSPSN